MSEIAKKRAGNSLRVARANERHVVRSETGWAIKKAGSERTTATYPTKAEAERAARDIANRQGGGEVVIHGRDGRIRERFTLGREAFAKISAVEQIETTGEIRREFREFDRKGVPASKRRQTILSKYGKKPA